MKNMSGKLTLYCIIKEEVSTLVGDNDSDSGDEDRVLRYILGNRFCRTSYHFIENGWLSGFCHEKLDKWDVIS